MMAAALTGEAYAADSCTALALSGGGSNGSWEAGVFWGFLHYGNKDDFAYDVMTGVSAGSINAAALAGWAVGKEYEASEWMSDMWNSLTNDDIWTDWPWGGKAKGLTVEAGVVDNSPLLTFLRKTLSDNFTDWGRRVTYGTANVNDGSYTTFSQNNISFLESADAAFASASIPFIFPNYNWEGKGVFMDGGTVYNINLDSAIEQCMEIVDDESKITIDILICGSNADPEIWDKAGNSWSNYFRARDLHKFYNGCDDISHTMQGHPKINYRYTLVQEESLSGFDELSFGSEKTWPMQELGRQQAQDALNSSNVNELFHAYHQDEALQATYPKVGDFIDTMLRLK